MDEGQGPVHVAIITDGNGRWAKSRGLPVAAGHRAGAENVRARLADAVELGIRELTVYALSTENWARPQEEVNDLIDLIAEYIDRVTPELHAENVRLRFIGDRGSPVPPSLAERMQWADALTAANDLITLFVPFNYSGRTEILHAAEGFEGTTEDEFRRGLYAPDMHDPELLIRTGGERRLSNYLLWQVAESELVFSDELWPEFSRGSFEESIEEFRRREKRRRSDLAESNSAKESRRASRGRTAWDQSRLKR
jgi:undecaprenyl diphosphate synthase